MRRLPGVLPTAALAITLMTLGALAPAAGAQAPRLTRCPGQAAFECGTINVPLDYTGRVPGNIPLRFAERRAGPSSGKIIFALTGGPGQQGIDFATSSALSLAPALREYRLVVLDQRGTGKSGVLRCPSLQSARALDVVGPASLAACANRIGPRRQFYTSADTVLDLETVRKVLGAPKVALMGISYGTHVALQYARAFPANVDRLLLDSIVGPTGPDAFLLDTYRTLPRLLREQCANDRCAGATADPVADVAALVNRINTRGPLRGTFFDANGRPQRTSYAAAEQLLWLLSSGDLNPLLRAELPGAIGAARRGDTAELMRIKRIADGGPTPTTDLSSGLFVTTGCLDTPLPYSISATPIPARAAASQAALAAIPPTEYAPFDPQTVLRSSFVDDCSLWPNDVARQPYTGPLPDVPALLLGGRLDTRTPIENARATAAQLPHATVVALGGSGHDAIDSDDTGCVDRAVRRFFANQTVGDPCRGRNTSFRPLPSPPRSLDAFRSAPGVGGLRGRALFGVLDSVNDAIITGIQLETEGLAPRGGGLRAGSFRFFNDDANIRFRRYAYVPGLRISGTLRATDSDIIGRLTVTGPRGTSGSVELTRGGGAIGRLGGRPFRFRPGSSVSAASATSAHRIGVAAGTNLLRLLKRPAAAKRLVP
jgi:pimeloyl-ACP methyl ester carboxylesterase